MADPDPEHEIRNVEGPADGSVESPGPYAGYNLVADRGNAKKQQRERQAKARPPQRRRRPQHGTADVLGNGAGFFMPGDKGNPKRGTDISHSVCPPVSQS